MNPGGAQVKRRTPKRSVYLQDVKHWPGDTQVLEQSGKQPNSSSHTLPWAQQPPLGQATPLSGQTHPQLSVLSLICPSEHAGHKHAHDGFDPLVSRTRLPEHGPGSSHVRVKKLRV